MARKQPVERHSYQTIPEAAEMPNLLEVLLDSYNNFLQTSADPDKRENYGLQQIFQEIFPISDINDNYSLEFVRYTLGTPRYSVDSLLQ